MEVKDTKIVVSDTSKNAYLSRLIPKIWKILPLFEEYGKENIEIYVNGLLIDLCSADMLFDGCLSEIIVKLNSVIVVDMTHKEIKKKILECMDIIALKKND